MTVKLTLTLRDDGGNNLVFGLSGSKDGDVTDAELKAGAFFKEILKLIGDGMSANADPQILWDALSQFRSAERSMKDWIDDIESNLRF